MKFLLIEDHELYAEGLSQVLREHITDVEVYFAKDYSHMLSSFERIVYDVVFLDINLGGIDTMLRLKEIKVAAKGARIIILTSYFTPDLVESAKSHGLDGFLVKNSSKQEIIYALNAVLQDDEFVVSGFARINNFENYDGLKNLNILSLREREIISLLAKGNSNSQVAQALFISVNTVHTHRKNIYRKLSISSIQELISLAYKYKIVSIN